MASLTLPQVAATLASALVGYEAVNAAGARLLDERMLNIVLVRSTSTWPGPDAALCTRWPQGRMRGQEGASKRLSLLRCHEAFHVSRGARSVVCRR
jgi:hypothetical protein